MILITTKIKTKTTLPIITAQEPATKTMATKAKEITTPRTTTKKSQSMYQFCQQGTAVQNTRSTETSITVLGQTQTRGLTSDW